MNGTVQALKVQKSREVLQWCIYGSLKMAHQPTGPDWILVWAGTIALLRAVGHVLDKEGSDPKTDQRLQTAIKGHWSSLKKTKPNPAIFWKFIQEDRNILLKDGEFRAGQSVEIKLTGVSATFLTENQTPPPVSPQPPSEPIYSYHMNDGDFVGRDPRDLVAEAIRWWEAQFQQIESAALNEG